MPLPMKIKNMNMFNEGQSYLGQVASVTLPKLGRKLEGWRGGGMDGAVKIDMGAAEDLDLECQFGGPMRDVLRQFGGLTVAGIYLRFVGAYVDDATGTLDTIEITVRGRWEELEMGEAKPGEGGEFKTKFACAYYRLDWNGTTEIEIDRLNGVFNVGGQDMTGGTLDAVR